MLANLDHCDIFFLEYIQGVRESKANETVRKK